MNDVVGIYYQDPKGIIWYYYGSTKTHIIVYNSQDKHKKITKKQFQKWKPREDLVDFADTKNPRLPYIFDLFFDIKRTNEFLAYFNAHDSTDFREDVHGFLEDLSEEDKIIFSNGIQIIENRLNQKLT